ncbi:MAG: hypothetical protein AMXMBFR4_14780 [Candidatus Hydrogenedentota bacterium]
MSETVQRKRVSAKDFPKREIVITQREMPPAPPALAYWSLLPAAGSAVLWFFVPAFGVVWPVLTVCLLWLGLGFMLHRERRREDLEVDREIALRWITHFTGGVALGCLAYLVYGFIAG